MALFRKPIHGYEFAGHFIGDGEGAQTFVVIDTAAHAGTTWTPNGLYELGKSNYDVLYCCDVETMIVDGTYYKRVNLEDSEYYTEAQANMIRAIVSNAYPYVSLEEMKANLAENGFAYAEEMTRSEIISAVQAAIWASANGMTADDFRYDRTYRVTDNFGWGQPVHDISDEAGYGVQGKRKFESYPEVGVRHDALVDYLLALEPVEATHNQIVITKIDVANSKIYNADGIYDVRVNVELNRGADSNDDVVIHAYVGDEIVETIQVTEECNYALSFKASVSDNIKVVVTGSQNLEKGVYFYAPKPADANGDGIATSREVSQNLVGVSMGTTPVHAEAPVIPDFPEEAPKTFALSIKKVDDLGNPLTGVSFDLFCRAEGVNYLIGSYDVDENGFINVNDLMPGQYVLTETKTPDAYMTLSGEIVFTINEEGAVENAELPAGVSINENTDMIEITVVNTRISTQVILDGTKYLDGEEAGGFEFALMQGEEILQTVLSGENGIFTFDKLIFTEEGVYTYEIVEVAGDAENIYYDETVFTVTITVVREGRELIATVEGAESIEFFNETLFELPDPEPPLGPPQTGDAISTAIAAVLASLMGICILPKRKHN